MSVPVTVKRSSTPDHEPTGSSNRGTESKNPGFSPQATCHNHLSKPGHPSHTPDQPDQDAGGQVSARHCVKQWFPHLSTHQEHTCEATASEAPPGAARPGDPHLEEPALARDRGNSHSSSATNPGLGNKEAIKMWGTSTRS